jgi:hypothetical protein
MGTSDPRIVAVTDSTALVIGLTCLQHPWDMTCFPASRTDVAEVATGADVLVVDLGATDAGLDAVRHALEARRSSSDRGQPPRAVIIGDEQPAQDPPVGATVLLRPYTLPQLEDVIRMLLRADRPEQVPLVVPLEGLPIRQEESTPSVRQRPLRPPRREVVDGAGAPPEDGPPEESGGETPDAVKAPLPTRLFGRMAHAPVHGSLETDPAAAETDGPVAGAADGGTPDEDGSVHHHAHIDVAGNLADAEREPADTGLIDLTRESPQPRRWFARQQRPVHGRERQLRERLAAVLAATSELERLIEEVPLLVSLAGLAEAIVDDLRGQLEADTVALWRLDGEGWSAIAHAGLSKVEASWHVPVDHPLFSEIDNAGGGILLDPVDAVQEAVAGVGGAHTTSFMAASIAAGHSRFGLLTVGRDRSLTADDLDVLIDIASEAAPGIAVAEQLARFQASSASTPDPALA